MALINTEIQPFTAQAFKNGEFIEVSEKDIAEKWAIFFFYPADFTFVCPTELGDVQDKYAELQSMGVEVFSVSTDTHFVHKAWHDRSDTIGKIEYTMIGDPNGVITNNFEVLAVMLMTFFAKLKLLNMFVTIPVKFARPNGKKVKLLLHQPLT